MCVCVCVYYHLTIACFHTIYCGCLLSYPGVL